MRTLSEAEKIQVSGAGPFVVERHAPQMKDDGSTPSSGAVSTAMMACVTAEARTAKAPSVFNAALTASICVDAFKLGGTWLLTKANNIPVNSNPNPTPAGWR